MRLEAQVYNAAGTLQGEGPIQNIQAATLTRVLDGPGELTITMPAADPRVQDLIDNERCVTLIAHESDTDQPGAEQGSDRTIGTGIIRRVSGNDTGSQVMLALTGPDEMEELRRKNLNRNRIYDGDAVADVVDAIVALVDGWSVDTSTAVTTEVYARFDGSSALKALQEIAKRYGQHFRLSASKDLDFGPLGDAAPVRLIQAGSQIQPALAGNDDVALIKSLRWDMSSEDVVNWIEPVGGTGGEAALTLQHSTRGADRESALTGYATSNQDSDADLRCLDGTLKDKLAQSFQVSSASWVTHLYLYLKKTGSPTGTLTIRIETDSSGSPSGTLAHANATTTLAESGLATSYTLEQIAFTTGFYLSASTTYWIVVSTDRSASHTDYVQWGVDNSSPSYTSGSHKYETSSTWTATAMDAIFFVYSTIDSRPDATIATHMIAGRDIVLTGYEASNQDSYAELRGTTGVTKDKLAQSFMLTAASPVTHLDLYLLKAGSPTGTLTIRIETDSSGSPSGTLAHANATTTLAESGLATGYLMTRIEFGTSFTLSAGVTYWIVISTDRSASGTNYVQWGLDNSSPTAYGVHKYEASSTWTVTATDAIFMVYSASVDGTPGVKTLGLEGSSSEHDYTGATITESTYTVYDGTRCFDNNTSTYWLASTTTGWVAIEFLVDKTVDEYEVRSSDLNAPKDWTFEGWNGSGWDVLDTQSGETGWGSNEARSYPLASAAYYTKYQLNVTANNGGGGYNLLVRELNLISLAYHDRLGQSFYSGTDGARVASVTLPLAVKGTPGGNVYVKIEPDSSGSPSGTAVDNGQSANVATSSIGATQESVTFTFTLPPWLDAATTYWIVLYTTAAASSTDGVLWYVDTDAGYVSGEMQGYYAGWSDEDADGLFTVTAECVIEPYTVKSTSGPNSTTIYFLSDSDSITNYGQIERVLSVNVAPLSHSETDIVNAANALYDAAANWLQRHAEKQTSYYVTLEKLRGATILPGHLIRMQYHGMVENNDGDTVMWRDVDDDYWVIAVSENLTQGTVTLELSTIDRIKEEVTDLIINVVERETMRDVQVKPYPTVWQTGTMQDTVQYAGDYVRSYGTISFGKSARFVVPIKNSIMFIDRAILNLQTRPLSSTTLADDVDGNNSEFNVWYAVTEDDNYPANISLYIDGVDVSSALGGPWLASNENEALDIELDITDYVSTDGIPNYGETVIEVTCGQRTIGASNWEDWAVAGYEPWPNASGGYENVIPTHGVVQAAVDIHCSTQAIKLT